MEVRSAEVVQSFPKHFSRCPVVPSWAYREMAWVMTSFCYSITSFCMRMNFYCLVHESCTQQNRFPPFRHRHLPPPQALLARQALQVPQARQVQLLPAVAQVPLLLRCLEWHGETGMKKFQLLVVGLNGNKVRRGCAVISTVSVMLRWCLGVCFGGVSVMS